MDRIPGLLLPVVFPQMVFFHVQKDSNAESLSLFVRHHGYVECREMQFVRLMVL